MRTFAMLLALSGLTVAVAAQPFPAPDTARVQLDRAERAWLDAYDDNDREAMARFLADGFTITYADGEVETRADVLNGLDPSEGPDEGPSHYTENRSIRVIRGTALLSGIYVSPGDDGEPDQRYRYTDTWMWIDGRWQVVASHLSTLSSEG
jgi:ketosteroid isomerase-like protein